MDEYTLRLERRVAEQRKALERLEQKVAALTEQLRDLERAFVKRGEALHEANAQLLSRQ